MPAAETIQLSTLGLTEILLAGGGFASIVGALMQYLAKKDEASINRETTNSKTRNDQFTLVQQELWQLNKELKAQLDAKAKEAVGEINRLREEAEAEVEEANARNKLLLADNEKLQLEIAKQKADNLFLIERHKILARKLLILKQHTSSPAISEVISEAEAMIAQETHKTNG